jgi:hypothetical protein
MEIRKYEQSQRISSPRGCRIARHGSPTLLPCILSHTSTTSINIQIREPPAEHGLARGEPAHCRDANGATDPFGNFSDPAFSHLVLWII